MSCQILSLRSRAACSCAPCAGQESQYPALDGEGWRPVEHFPLAVAQAEQFNFGAGGGAQPAPRGARTETVLDEKFR